MQFGGKEVLNWSLNDYLGLANHPEVRKADTDAAIKSTQHILWERE
jgi:glycine C-acetyltransferase